MKQKLTLSITSNRITKAKRHVKRKGQSVSEFVEQLIDKAVDKPKRKSWVSELYGSAPFNDKDLEQDERLRDLVSGARTKATKKPKR